MTECRMWNCSNPARTHGRFCSDECRVLYDKRKAEAREAERSMEEQARKEAQGDSRR